MKQGEITQIKYKRSTNLGEGTQGEVTTRYIIPTFTPHTNIKAIDVTELSEEDRNQLQQWVKEYHEYYKRATLFLFKFDTWIEHCKSEKSPSLKWRTFKIDNITEID